MAMASSALHHPLYQSISLKYPHLSHNSRFSPSRLRFTSLRFPSTIRATSAVALEPELSTQQNQAIEVDPFACPVCYEPLIRKGPPGFNLPAIYRSGFKCKKCTKTYSSKDNYLDLTITAGMKDYTEINPVRTELFRSPLVSFLYERGWRQSFNQSGFPGPDEEFEMAQEYFKPVGGGLLVDVSCGSGLFSRKFAKSGAYSKVIALDFSENMLRQCYDYIKRTIRSQPQILVLSGPMFQDFHLHRVQLMLFMLVLPCIAGHLLPMLMSGEAFLTRFNGKNYASWEFQFRMFVKGKELWGHLDGSSPAPTEPQELGIWTTKDAKIVSWILGSVEPHMINNLRSFGTGKEIWDYFRRIYSQNNSAQKFQVEMSIANYKQGNLSIEQFYAGFLNLWSEYTGIIYSKIPKDSLEAIYLVYAESQRDQFLMKLRPEFEAVRASLINRSPVPTLDECLGELLREEQRLATQHELTQDTVTEMNVAYMAQGRGRQRGGSVQCFNCKELGHIARNCSKKFCNYCKKEGHVIRECRLRPQNRQGFTVQSKLGATSMAAAAVSSPLAPESSSSVSSSSGTITPEMVQQMIISAFSALGISGSSVGEGDREGA